MTGSYYNQTTLHPLGLLAVVLCGIAMLFVPRRYALVPLLVTACFVSPAQRLVIASLDFNLVRLLVLFGWTRVLMLGAVNDFRPRRLDALVVLWTLSATVVTTLREGTAAAFINKLGVNYDVIGLYFLFRILIRDWRDVEILARAAALISIPVAAVFLVEQITGRNVFSIFGGVSLVTEVREGRIRCRGPFAHPIYAGCFWAALTPLFASLWWGHRRWRWLAPAGIGAAVVVVLTCASSTPVLALLVAATGFALQPFRRWVPVLRWSALMGLVSLHFVMQAPVWHLIARADLVGGSTGWYRYKMIDGFLRHFDQWWLLGTRSYHDIWDEWYRAITNQYVFEGLEGGLVTLLVFGAVIVSAFRSIGRAEASLARARFPRIIAWAVGVSLLVHCVDFLAVSYFGQVLLAWYLTLAVCGSLAPARRRCVVRVAAPPRRDARLGSLWPTSSSASSPSPDRDLVTP